MRRACIVGCGTTRFTSDTSEALESVLLRSVKNLFDSTPECDRRDVEAVIVSNASGGYAGTGSAGHDSYGGGDNSGGGGVGGGGGGGKGGDGGSDSRGGGGGGRSRPGSAGSPPARDRHAPRMGSGYMAPILAELAGMRPRAAHTVESLCSSGTNAIVSGYAHVASGLADVVLVSGAEIRDTPGRILWWDDSRGQFKHPVYWASLLTSGYKRAFGVSDDDLAVVPTRAYANAGSNPDALRPEAAPTVEDVAGSRRLTGDLRLLDCSRPCTGGASILITSEDVAGRYTDDPVLIAGIGQSVTSAGFAKHPELSRIVSARMACRDALRMAGSRNGGAGGATLSISDVDVAEIHDAFSVCEPMILEALGMAEPGRGAAVSRELYETASRRVNPRGGLIGSGHPLGATGLAQAAEVARQLWRQARGRQADNPEVGLVHNMAAAGTSSTALVMVR
ncbi:MAG: thiolase family protein [Thaumarchaeota archaeon]|nr:thiolase family protein [Nitrososphaerota archaeon]